MMSDWGATHSTAKAINAGLDVEMGSANWMEPAKIEAAMKLPKEDPGYVSETRIDETVYRILKSLKNANLLLKVNLPPKSNATANRLTNTTNTEQKSIAREIARASLVLLKNDRIEENTGIKLLPLDLKKPYQTSTKKFTELHLYGCADNCLKNCTFGCDKGCSFWSRGGGSGTVVPSEDVTISQGIRDHLKAAGLRGEDMSGIKKVKDFELKPEDKNRGWGDIQTAPYTENAAQALAVVCLSSYSEEGTDRASLHLPSLPPEVSLPGSNYTAMLVVASVPGPVIMPDFTALNKKKISVAALFGAFPGEQIGHAVADLVFGNYSPSGKLSFTLPNRDNPLNMKPTEYPGESLNAIYSEGLKVGHRYYQSSAEGRAAVGYSFGSGFTYNEDVLVDDVRVRTWTCPKMGKKMFAVSLCLQVNMNSVLHAQYKNVSSEVVQLYHRFEGRDYLELTNFAKIPVNDARNCVNNVMMFEAPIVWSDEEQSYVEKDFELYTSTQGPFTAQKVQYSFEGGAQIMYA